MPDGSTHPAYADKDNTTTYKITKENWIYRSAANNQYELILTDGTIYKFSAHGASFYLVDSITTTNGNTITFTYLPNKPGQLVKITDNTSSGHTINIGYTAYPLRGFPNITVDFISSISGAGGTFSYTYEQFPDTGFYFLKKVSSNVGSSAGSWSYTYHTTGSSYHQLKSITYPSGSVLSYGYSDVPFDTGYNIHNFSVVTSRTFSGRGITSATWNYAYNANTNNSQVSTITYPNCGKVKTERYTFASIAELGNSFGKRNLLWRVGKLLKKEILDGGIVERTEVYEWVPGTSVSLENLYTTGSFAWDDEIFLPLLDKKTITQDGRIYTTTYRNYDPYGNPKTITESGEGIRTTTLSYFYNSSKNIVANYPLTQNVSVSGETFTTSFTYDANNGNLKTLTRYGVTTTFGYTNGNMTSRTDTRGKKTTFQYSKGLVSKITKPASTIYSISRTINSAGTIQSETNGRGQGYTTNFQYDRLNRITLIDPPEGNSTTITYTTSNWKVSKGNNFTQYNVDGLGRVTSTSAAEGILTKTTYNTCGEVVYQSYPYAGTANIGDNFVYDVLGRVETVTHPDSTSQVFTYSGNKVSIKNERNISTTRGYESFGDPEGKRLVSVLDATGTTSYAYNAVGSLKRITHPGGLQRNFSFNSKNFMTSETQPEIGTISYGHDPVGNVISKLDGKGTTTFTYDGINRLTNIDYPGVVDDTSFIYDKADNRKTMTSDASSHVYDYDTLNRIKLEKVTIGGKIFSTKYTYNPQGNLAFLEYPTGRTLSYFYDSADRVTNILGYVSTIFYHPSGGIDHLQFGNAKQTDFTYDNRSRIKIQSVSSVMNDTYAYDGVGNITSISGNNNRSMGYDNVDRLTTATGVWGSLAFTYSTVGNRKTRTLNGSTKNFNYSSISNRLTSISGAESDSFEYDTNGNMTFVRGRVLDYNSLNQLIQATHPNACCVDYIYDGDGKRIKKIDQTPSGKTTLYHHDAAGNILVESNPNGLPYAEYVYLNGQRIAKVIGGDFNPSILDTDGDGLPDDYEIQNGLNPNDPFDASIDPVTSDPDGDGFTNLEEYEAGSDPNDPLSTPASLAQAALLAAWLVPIINLLLQ